MVKKNKDITAEELIAVLKFTPIRVRMLIQGYGGECYAGRVDRKIYEYFKQQRIDIEEYASAWDDQFNIPDDLQPFPAGAPFECNNLFQASGAELSELNEIRLENADTGETIWVHNMSWSDLEDHGVVVDEFDNVDFDDLDEGEVVFWGGQGEKGCFFDAEFTLTEPFDPKKLNIKFETCDGWHIVNYVEYDGEDLDGSGGYSTTGKWAESKWVLGGDEEGYDPVALDDREDEGLTWDTATDGLKALEDAVGELQAEFGSTDEEWDPAEELDKIIAPYQVTDWFDKKVKPVHVGDYECEFVIPTWPWPAQRMCEWTGKSWKEATGDRVKGDFKWRGLKEKAQ